MYVLQLIVVVQMLVERLCMDFDFQLSFNIYLFKTQSELLSNRNAVFSRLGIGWI